MKKIYFKPTSKLFVFVLSLSMLLGLSSCDKEKSLNELYGTWESDDFEIEYKSSALPPFPYSGEELVLRGKMTLRFMSNSISSVGVNMIIYNLELFDRKNNITYDYADMSCCPMDVSCTYDRKTLTLTFGDNSPFPKQIWKGKVHKNTMKLTVIFGETVKLKKK